MDNSFVFQNIREFYAFNFQGEIKFIHKAFVIIVKV